MIGVQDTTKVSSTHLSRTLSKRLRTPEQVQAFLRTLPYNRETDGESLRSAEETLRRGSAHCLEAVLVAAAILEHHGLPTQAVSFESQDGLDHVIYVFQRQRKWGAIARSRDEGLHGRAPIFRSVRDLVWSYYDDYIDGAGKITAYQHVFLDDSKTPWRASSRNVWALERYLIDLPHRRLVSSKARYRRVLQQFKARGAPPLRPYCW